ncbi:DegT/DnrJ/EryC1/StrS family aminotransferase [Mariprofundus ferrooxydans]|uniref:Pilin glycosylation protein n=1 Tax=Mariprofundus ferrooxydans PV-1 TaxID=314345 RepID=Q0EYK9_9PROT|nr:DegT/DnrJ/EryC1/StrS aminotransferase family protein [Mariprofundus ferrooxydans]EAU54358.1 pilin glycosylation protein [Mariprofundus ferrooxydans PV-1]KON47419.1 aminotransferase [Mariprofundus ferrooxydans]
MSFPVWPEYAEDEIAAVEAVLRSGKVNYWSGDQGSCFEMEFAAFTGTSYAIALANGTLALEAALYALGIGPDDEVIVPARTFIATASSVVMRGAVPVVADIDLRSGNLTVDTIDAARTENTKAIIVVHLGGWPCDMPRIMAYAELHGLKVIEDCAQAHGAEIDGRKVGSFGHASAFSFCQDKIITTGGEGGMLVTDDQDVWRKVWSLKDHGRDYDEVFHSQHGPGHRWLCTTFGSNWRLTEMQSAIGRIQLKKLPSWLASRRRSAQTLAEGLSDLVGLNVWLPDEGILHAWYRFYACIDSELLQEGWNQDRIIEAIAAEGVPCFHGSCSEIYREKAFDQLKQDRYPLPNAQLTSRTSMALLLHPTLRDEHIEKTIAVVRDVFERAVG